MILVVVLVEFCCYCIKVFNGFFTHFALVFSLLILAFIIYLLCLIVSSLFRSICAL